MLILVDRVTRTPINVGDTVRTFRGEVGVVRWMERPAHMGTTGRVGVALAGSARVYSWYPGVIGAVWIESVEV